RNRMPRRRRRTPLPLALALALALAASAAAAPAARAEDVTLSRKDAPIRSATVYASQALVKRGATIEAKGGPLHVRLEHLPPGMRDDSLRIRAGAGLTLQGSRVVERAVREANREDMLPLMAELEKLEAERQGLADAKEVVERTIAHIQAIQAAHASDASAIVKATPDQLGGVVTWAEVSLGKAYDDRRKAAAELAKADEKKAELERKLQALAGAPGTEKAIEVDLEATAGGKLQVEFEYVTDGASWTPFYDFRADADAKAIEATYFGLVRQTTGEDWKDVKLALSTARPELGARPPDLPGWIVRLRPRYEDRNVEADTPSGAPAAAGAAPSPSLNDSAAAKERQLEEGKVLTARAEQRGATVAFAIATPETIPSDGQEKRTTIGKASFKADAHYFTVPKVSPFAYLRATVSNAFGYPMLAGEANVFFGPDFVGRSRVDLVAPGDKLEVYLGVDERLKIERKLEKRFRDTKGVFTTDVRERYEYTISAKNGRADEALLTIVDQLPVSRDEEIKVEDVKLTLEPREKDEATGERRWTVGIKPKSEVSLGIGFTIRFPEKKEADVIGIER
ncbi:MAG TPA: mucoidy inhibitor MuiA family protein, partial [Planctomycetota bacterium]|nr:mucoidy inhibitor MuiA family protein [Planctomycetota bacterium]